MRLTESYRSTREMTEFTRALLAGGEPVVAIERPGELPQLMRSASKESLAEDILRDVRALQEDGLTSIAVICKTARESWKAWGDLNELAARDGQSSGGAGSGASSGTTSGEREDKNGIHLVKTDDRQFRRGVLVIPSYLARGLEFEAVVIYDAGRSSYSHPRDRRVLYTACTRALHRLHIHYAGHLSPFISEADPSLFHEVDAARD